MRTLLQSGQRLKTEFTDQQIIVDKLLGEGGQGEVYAAEMARELVAVKWYKPDIVASDHRLLDRLRRLRDGKKPPGAKYLWPIDVVRSTEISGFGYVMPFREKRFRELDEIIAGDPAMTLRGLATAGIEFAETFKGLHASGFCYHDINRGNLAVDPSTCEVRICDTDNVDRNGIPSGVYGTDGFMAPEIVQRQELPTTHTDLWSLAALLFSIFIGQHPLLGRRESESPMLSKSEREALLTRLYGAEALFIFNPHDNSNALVPGYHDGALRAWSGYPQFLRDLFTQAFTVGIRRPSQRVFDSEWRKAMAKLRDVIMLCPHCGAEIICDHTTEKHQVGENSGRPLSPPIRCWNCGERLSSPQCIALPGGTVVMTDGAALFRHHLDLNRIPGSSEPIARVVRHPTAPDVIGLENLGATPWRVVRSDGKVDQIDPTQKVGLAAGLRITFGPVEGTVS